MGVAYIETYLLSSHKSRHRQINFVRNHLLQDHLDKIGDEFLMTPTCIKPGNAHLNARSVQSLSTSYYGQNGGGTMPREHRRPIHSAATVESHFLSPPSPIGSLSGRHHHQQQYLLNGSATRAPMIPETVGDDLMNDESDSVSQSSRPGKFKPSEFR